MGTMAWGSRRGGVGRSGSSVAGLLLGALLVAAVGCAPVVRSHRIRPDYNAVDRDKVKRVLVVTQPLPDGQAKAGELFSLVARRYVNQKRNFIVKEHTARAEPAPGRDCPEGFEGLLWLKPTLKRVGDGVEGELDARLLRCSDGEEVWAAQSGGSFPSDDSHLKEVTQQYAAELGSEVAPYVAPTFNLLRPTLDTLPNPVLTEDDVNEKIELGE